MTVALPELASWVVSPGYLADTDSEPVAVGMILAEHLAKASDALSVQVPEGENEAVPEGGVGLVEVSVTDAVHDVGWSINIVVGVQATFVLVGCRVTDAARLGASIVEL